MPAMPVDITGILHSIAKDTPALPAENLPQDTTSTTAKDIDATIVENVLQNIRYLIATPLPEPA
jgi:hypothetical protein